jgi:hypothetical protein
MNRPFIKYKKLWIVNIIMIYIGIRYEYNLTYKKMREEKEEQSCK